MGEYVWTSIKIGGKASRATLLALIEAADDCFSEQDFGLDTDTVADFTAGDIFFAGLCNYGKPEGLEDLCREKGLVYHLSWGAASGNFDSGCRYWCPEMSGPDEREARDDGEPTASLREIRALADAGHSIGALAAILARASVDAVPPLEWDGTE